MPCASVSEKPTRVSEEYLKGGLRSVSRPSSSALTSAPSSNAAARSRRVVLDGALSAAAARERRQALPARPVAEGAPGELHAEPDEQEREHGGRNDRVVDRDQRLAARAAALRAG